MSRYDPYINPNYDDPRFKYLQDFVDEGQLKNTCF